MSADVYSLSIIIYELFSSIDPFPGSFIQIFEAKRLDEKPCVPSDFPSDLIELILRGWSFNPKKRPPVQEFKAALNKMLTGKETDPTNYLSFSSSNLSNETKQPVSHQEFGLSEIQSEGIESETVPKENLKSNPETGD